MASAEERRAENVAGDFFVDSSCIDCDTCRWMAPGTYRREGGQSAVHAQPGTAEERVRALQALVSCPTASIGTGEKHAMAGVLASFPIPVEELDEARGVYHCGYHAESSFGAASYLIRRPEGNVLVDSPRFAKPLVRRLEELGGVDLLFLTHRDDVADHERYHEHFGCERILHKDDARGALLELEHLVEGDEPVRLDDELTILPVPGHTEGSAVLCWRDTYLFSGDHVAWSSRLEQIYAFKNACWYDWHEQIESMRRTAELDFEWILPGHGHRCHFPLAEMRERMGHAIEWMERA